MTDSNQIVSTASADHYKWGGPNGIDSDGWHLVRTDELSVIEEYMPPGTREARHSHVRVRQFFYVLAGQLTLEIEQREFVLRAGDGIEIHPGQRHQALNQGSQETRFLVVSQPKSHGDRVND